MTAESESATTKPLLRRPWIWIVAAIIAAFILYHVNDFPSGRYTCTWSGIKPSGELAGDLVVVVGNWPNTFPLKARIFTSTGPVNMVNWSHVHSYGSRELVATIPIGSGRFQALCEL